MMKNVPQSKSFVGFLRFLNNAGRPADCVFNMIGAERNQDQKFDITISQGYYVKSQLLD